MQVFFSILILENLCQFMKMLVNLITLILLAVLPNTYAIFRDQIEFTYPKVALVYTCALLIVANFAIKIFRSKQILIKLDKIDILVLLFLATYIISTLFSINIYTSILSDFYSSVKTGLLFIASLSIIYFYYRYNFKPANLRIVLWVTLLSIVFGIYWGYHTRSAGSFYNGIPIRMASVEFNVIFFSNYLLLLPPVAIALAIYEKRWLLKFIAGVSLILGIFAIILSLTRSAWVVSSISLLLFATLYYKNSANNLANRSKILIISVVLVIIGVLVYLFYPILYPRIVAINNDPAQTNSVTIRLNEQKSAIEIAKDYPLIGAGPNTVRYTFNQYRDPTLNLNPAEWNNFTTYIRNYYLEIAATIGFIGLAFYLEIIINSIRKLRYILSSNNYLLIGLLLSWVSIVIHHFFYGPTPLSLVIFWSFLGMLASTLPSKPVLIINNKILSSLLSFLLIALTLASATLLFFDVKSKILFHSVPRNSATTQTLNELQEASRLNPYDPSYKVEYAYRQLRSVHFEINTENPKTNQINDRLQKVRESLDKAEKIEMENPKTAFYRAESSNYLFRIAKFDKKDRAREFELALKEAHQAESLASTMPDYLDLVTQVYLENDAKNLKEAEAQARKTISIAPTYSQAWHHLGEALKQQGRFDEAIAAYETTLKYDNSDQISKKEIEEIKKLKNLPTSRKT
jgi:O-antigen ligase